jgi:hypothetical protein
LWNSSVPGVQVLGFAAVEDPAAEADRAAARVSNREHHPVPETVVEARCVCASRLRLPLDDEPGPQQYLAVVVRRAIPVEQGVPARRGKADAEALDDVGRETSLPEVLARPGLAAQRLAEKERGAFERHVQLVVRLRRCSGAALARHLETCARRQLLDRLDEAQVVVLHDEAECGAVCSAAEAVENCLSLTVNEGTSSGRGKEALLAPPASARAADHPMMSVGDELVNEVLGDAGGHGVADSGWR